MEKQLEQLNGEQAIVDEIKGKIRSMYELDYDRVVEAQQRIIEIAAELESKYPDAKRCYLFHVLIGSTTDRGACNRFDFPDADSVVKRTADLYEEYNGAAAA